MIHFECEHCGRPVRVADSYGGKKGRCPNCGEVVDIPPGSGALQALAAALGSDDTDISEKTLPGLVPPPPPVEQKRLDEELLLPEDEEALADTVILPAEAVTADAEPPESPLRRHYRSLTEARPALSPKRTFLVVALVVVVLAAAVVGFLVIYALTRP